MADKLTDAQLAARGYNWYTNKADNNFAATNHKLTVGNNGATVNYQFSVNVERDGRRTFRYQHISTLGSFANESVEELRLKDYGMMDNNPYIIPIGVGVGILLILISIPILIPIQIQMQ